MLKKEEVMGIEAGSYVPPQGRVSQALGINAEEGSGILSQDGVKPHRQCCLLLIAPGGNGQSGRRVACIHRQLRGLIPSADKVAWKEDQRLWVLLPGSGPSDARTVAEQVLASTSTEAVYEVYDARPTGAGLECTWVRVWPDQKGAVLALHAGPDRSMPTWKRVIDVIGASIGLVIVSPILLVAGAIIKCASKGPVFFRQQRIGHRGRQFTMLKLRTYHVGASQYQDHKEHMSKVIANGHHTNGAPMKKLDDHAGIIPFGRFLRKTCIDELPQLINVLKGQMSLVGPRPALPYEVELYSPWHFERFDAVPGMTGLWQVSGKNDLTFDQMVSLDIQYARRMSFWLDLWILIKTPAAIIRQIRAAFRSRPKRKSVEPGQVATPAANI